jgi:hypothetical protein
MKVTGVSRSIFDIFSLTETKDSMDSRENDEEYSTIKISWDEV